MNIAILPIKSDSKRIPMKLFKDFCGKPLWTWVATQVAMCPMIDNVVISCPDEWATNLARGSNIIKEWTILNRPKELAGDVELTKVIKHAAKQVAKSGDNILQIQLNKPLTKARDIMECLNEFITGGYDSLSTVQEVGTSLINNPSASSRLAYKQYKSQAICKIWEYDTLMTSLEPYAYSETNHYYKRIAKHHIEIDDMEDWKIAEALYRAGY